MGGVEMEEAGRRAGVGGHTSLVSLGLRGPPAPPRTFLLTRKLAATASPCVKLSMVLANRLR